MRYKILHITSHLGGGVGNAILGYLSQNKKQDHEVIALGYTLPEVQHKINQLKVSYTDYMYNKHKEIINRMNNFDVVLVHVWNQPLLMDFLVKNELPCCRLIMWGHVSGLYAPDVYTKKILEYPDMFVFTSPLSYDLDEVKSLGDDIVLDDIWSTGDIIKYRNIKHVDHDGFIVGYVGTVDYSKMHFNFLKLCRKIIDRGISDLEFVVIGGEKEKEIRRKANEMEIGNFIDFTGHIDNVEDYLCKFDVFGYPLNTNHFGTCDLALQEAISAGIPVVVFDNPMEKIIVRHNKTGIIVHSEEEYVDAICKLYENVEFRKQLSVSCKNDFDERFSISRLDRQWNDMFNRVMEASKKDRKWNINTKNIEHKDVFIESLGPKHGKIFIENDVDKIRELGKQERWKTPFKGTVHNYSNYFPEDRVLRRWSGIMKGI